MKYRVEKVGEDLFKVTMPWWYLGSGRLVSALLDLQVSGKVVTCVRKLLGTWRETYLVCTVDKAK